VRKFQSFRLFGLVFFLTVILVFVAIEMLEAKKPPKWEWRVGIPNEILAESEGCNLYGNPHGNQVPGSPAFVTYENNDFIETKFWTSEDKDTGEFHSIFSLKVGNTEKGLSDAPGYYSVGFRDVWFSGCKSYCFLGGEGPCMCWVLPNYGLSGVDCCVPLCCGKTDECGSDGFWVTQQFMQEFAHPSYGYDHFGLRFWVNTDIEAIEEGDYWEGEGYMWWLNLWNTGETLLDGNEDYHNIVCDYTIPLEGVRVDRTGANEWIITVDQCGPEGVNCPPSMHGHSGRYIVFWEAYSQGIEKQIGKSGKTSIEAENRRALGGATKFKFQTKWTRF
jgi:hypothetical protein